MERLLDKFKGDDAKSLKWTAGIILIAILVSLSMINNLFRSGTEEKYTELTQLLEDIH